MGLHSQGPEEARPGGQRCRVPVGWLGWGMWGTTWSRSRAGGCSVPQAGMRWVAAVPVALKNAVAMGTQQV